MILKDLLMIFNGLMKNKIYDIKFQGPGVIGNGKKLGGEHLRSSLTF